MKDVSVGIDIGGTNSAFGIIDRDGKILNQGNVSTKEHRKIEYFVDVMQQQIKDALADINEDVELNGIGIGAPNGNYYNGTIEHAANLDWKGIIPLKQLFNKYFDLPVVVTNDANAAAIGEKLFGGAKYINDFIVITLGTGLGSGIVVNGDLVYGHDGFAGEIGHTFVNLNTGRNCGCGRSGCLETYVSATGIKRTVYELLSLMNDTHSELRDISFDELDAERIYKAASNKDRIALEAFDYTGKILGLKLADSVAHLSPKAIFLFGGLAKAGDYIFNPTIKYFEENVFNIFKNKIKILPSELNEKNGAILGAAALIWKERKQ
jgi:glucokinase